MSSVIEPQTLQLGPYSVLCDAAMAAELSEDIFMPERLEELGYLTGRAQGRGEAWFFTFQSQNLVLRHFRRGGLVGRFIADHYFGLSVESSRAWSEWRLLAELYASGLPVPRPVAAAVRSCCGFYRAELLTELIADAEPLAACFLREPHPAQLWNSLGACLRRFHDQGVYHADLNANNILVDGDGKIFLIDFDRGALRRPGRWTRQNLQRLHRSLKKIEAAAGRSCFSAQDWQQLIDAYETSSR